MTKESKKLVKCPCCLRAFQSIEDYPVVRIDSFERTRIPEFVGATHCDLRPERKTESMNKPLPKSIVNLFEETGKDMLVFKGELYKKIHISENVQWYESSDDLTDIFKETIALPEIRNGLEYLETSVGRSIRTEELFALPAFRGNLEVKDFRDICLRLNDDGLGDAGVYLAGGGVGGFMSYCSLWQEVAKIKYVGRTMSG